MLAALAKKKGVKAVTTLEGLVPEMLPVMEQLLSAPQTVIHGDLRSANVSDSSPFLLHFYSLFYFFSSLLNLPSLVRLCFRPMASAVPERGGRVSSTGAVCNAARVCLTWRI